MTACKGCGGSGEVVDRGKIKTCPTCGGSGQRGFQLSKIGMWMGAVALALVLAACDFSNITPGGSCSAEGSKHTNSTGYTYTCKTDPGTGKRIWQQDAPLKKDRP